LFCVSPFLFHFLKSTSKNSFSSSSRAVHHETKTQIEKEEMKETWFRCASLTSFLRSRHKHTRRNFSFHVTS
jgi:hypothetical protein